MLFAGGAGGGTGELAREVGDGETPSDKIAGGNFASSLSGSTRTLDFYIDFYIELDSSLSRMKIYINVIFEAERSLSPLKGEVPSLLGGGVSTRC